ncbi:MAG: YeeE/YedE family protein [Proteobacteria bacterium]|nr:YeeE/YedE family protein [Pseudomonadota bacterium]
MNLLTQKRWNPYFAGALSGCVSIFSVWVAGKYLGASTTFARSAGLIENIFAPDHVEKLDYFIKYTPKIDWQWMFVVGIFFGAFCSALLSKDFKFKNVPDMWISQFGTSIPKRAIVAFVGGSVALFGARLAGGCPSGHGLSGSLQLSVSGLIALACFFIGGIIMAKVVYRGNNS